jgi:hypothetical protein
VNQTWGAYQDGDGAWQVFAEPDSAGHYQMEITGTHYSVVFVCASQDDAQSSGQLYRLPAATTSLDIVAGYACAGSSTQTTYHNLTGSLTSLPTSASSLYSRVGSSIGGATTLVQPSNGIGSYTAYGFEEGKTYDVAVGIGSITDLSKVVFLRGLTFDTELVQNVDFATGYDVTARNVAVSNATGRLQLNVHYRMSGPGENNIGLPINQGSQTFNDVTSTMNGAYAVIPSAATQVGDEYVLTAALSETGAYRSVERHFVGGEDIAVAMPDALEATFSSYTEPFYRPIVTFAAYPGVTQYELDWSYGPAKGESHSFTTYVDATLLTGSEPYSVTFPDLSAVSGFKSAWVAPSDATQASVSSSMSVMTKTTDASGSLETTVRASAVAPIIAQ